MDFDVDPQLCKVVIYLTLGCVPCVLITPHKFGQEHPGLIIAHNVGQEYNTKTDVIQYKVYQQYVLRNTAVHIKADMHTTNNKINLGKD